MHDIITTRVIRWTVPGYEDTFTQYQILADGSVWICQISLKDNTGRSLGGVPTLHTYRSVEDAEHVVQSLIESRAAFTEEIIHADPRKCPDCSHFKFAHGPEVPGCVECTCRILHEEDAK